MSIQDLQQNPQDVSNFYLANIYQATINPSAPNISSSLPSSPPPFSPPNYAVWVNALWFLSLVISLTCALLATLLQQWARRYLKVTQSRYNPHKRARIRAFFAEGVDKCLLPWAVETLPTLLHISLFLFFAGLVVFLSNVNMTIFKLVLSWVAVCTALYGCVTLMPIFRHDSPYYTSLSSSAWAIVIGMALFVSLVSGWLLYWTVFCRRRAERLLEFAERCYKMLSQGMQKTAEETALKSPSEIVNRALMWTFDSLDEDHELEHFFSGFPGFRNSKVVADPLPTLTWDQKERLYIALTGLLDRTLSSDLLPVPIKKHRATICAKAFDPAYTPLRPFIAKFFGIFSQYQYSGPLATAIVQILRDWQCNRDEAQAIISMILARVQPRDDSWFILASNELGVPEAVLRGYAAHGDSLSFSILIHIIRQQFGHFWNRTWPEYDFSEVLKTASKFEVQDTSPELQNEFCALWNQIVRKVQNDDDRRMAFHTLGWIRNVYLTLHQNTNSAPTQFSDTTSDQDTILWDPTTYPVCSIAGHHPDSTLHAGDDFNLGAAAGREDAMAALHMKIDTLDPSSAIHDDVPTSPNLPP